MFELIFWISTFIIFYVYLGYPLLSAGIAKIVDRKIAKAPYTPFVTVLIAAFNEQEFIEDTILNKLSQDYPEYLIEIIVISDSSTDQTDKIVRSIASDRVSLLRQEPRLGKTSALNLAVPKAKGEILVFSDANSIYAPDTIRNLVKNFSDPTVGYVTGKMIYANPDGAIIGEGCSSYMKYENALREIETRLGSIVGVDGGVDAVRKNLYQSMSADQLPDFVLPLIVVSQGYRVVYEPEAFLWEKTLNNASDEYRMRVRVSLRAFWALFDMKHLLGFRNNFIFSWQLWSHKLLRYCCFIFLIAALFSNAFILNRSIGYSFTFFIQFFFYFISIFTFFSNRPFMQTKFIKFIFYFSLINTASAYAFFKFLLGQKAITWNPRRG